jgi:hypothetical protein
VRHAVASQKALSSRGIDIGLEVLAVSTHYLRIEIHKMSVFQGCAPLDAMRGMTHRTRCSIAYDMVPVLSKYGILAGADQIEFVI